MLIMDGSLRRAMPRPGCRQAAYGAAPADGMVHAGRPPPPPAFFFCGWLSLVRPAALCYAGHHHLALGGAHVEEYPVVPHVGAAHLLGHRTLFGARPALQIVKPVWDPLPCAGPHKPERLFGAPKQDYFVHLDPNSARSSSSVT